MLRMAALTRISRARSNLNQRMSSGWQFLIRVSDQAKRPYWLVSHAWSGSCVEWRQPQALKHASSTVQFNLLLATHSSTSLMICPMEFRTSSAPESVFHQTIIERWRYFLNILKVLVKSVCGMLTTLAASATWTMLPASGSKRARTFRIVHLPESRGTVWRWIVGTVVP